MDSQTVVDFLNSVDWSTFLSAIFGALLGSLSAFWLGVNQQRRDQKAREHGALLRAQYALMSQWNILENIRRNLLENFSQNIENRHLKMPMYYVVASQASIQIDDISFIANSGEPNLLNNIHIAQQGFETAMETLRMRNQWIEKIYCSSNVKILEFNSETGGAKWGIESEAGKMELFFLKAATNNLFASVDQAILSLRKEMKAVEAYIKQNFKGMKALNLTPI